MSRFTDTQKDQPSISDVPRILWRHKVFLGIFTLFCTVGMLIYAITLPNVYTAEGLYMAKGGDDAGAMSKLASQFGGLASVAGINLGGGGIDKTEIALELITSRAFLQGFIEKHDLFVPLFAVNGWNKEDNELLIDDDIYDSENNIWVREVKLGKTPKPSSWEAYTKLREKIDIEYRPKKGIILIKITYYSPILAAEWIELLAHDINLFWKTKSSDETSKSIKFLTQQASETSVAELRKVFYELIAENTQTNLLSQITDEVMFETISNAVIPEEKSAPKRALLILFAMVIGSILAAIIVLVFDTRQTKKQHNN